MSSSPVVPEMHHVNILVADASASGEWYCQILGYLKERDFIEHGQVVGVALRHPNGGVRLALRQSPHRLTDHVGFAPIAWEVPTRADLDALVVRLKAHGVADAAVQPATSGSLLTFSDPDGYMVTIYSMDASAVAGPASR